MIKKEGYSDLDMRSFAIQTAEIVRDAQKDKIGQEATVDLILRFVDEHLKGGSHYLGIVIQTEPILSVHVKEGQAPRGSK